MNEDLNTVVSADSKRPYKMYAALLVAFLSTLITTELNMPPWGKALIVSVLAALAVYIKSNPITQKDAVPTHRDDTLF